MSTEKELRQRIETLKLMESLTRLRLILALLIFRKLSLTELSNLLGRVKSTLTHHIKKLEQLQIIKSTRKEARGSIDAKVYELIPGFLERLHIDSDKIGLDLSNEIILNDLQFFKVIKVMYEQVILYYEAVSKQKKTKSFKDFRQDHFKSPISYNYWFLSENAHIKYEKLVDEFGNRLKKIIAEDNLKNPEAIRPFLVLHTFFPLKQIIEYDSELNEFRKFFQALE
ncbi:MAG: ArsR family transcriptional regulator [Promethearchaeota archaeon]